MEVKVLKSTKDEIEVQLGNVTIAEVLRNYLNEDSAVTFAAWKRIHPTEMPILKVQTKGKTAKKAIDDAVSVAVKVLDRVDGEFKKLK